MISQQYMSMQWTQNCVYLHTTQQQQRQLLTCITNYDMLPNLVKYDTTIHTAKFTNMAHNHINQSNSSIKKFL